MTVRKPFTLTLIALAIAAPSLASASSLYHPAGGEVGFTTHPDHFQSTTSREDVLQAVAVARKDGTLAILQRGVLVAEGAVADLLDRDGRFWLEVDLPDRVLARLGERAEAGDGGVYVRVERSDVPDLIQSLATAGTRIHEAKWIKPDLETVFLSETREVSR